MGREAQGRRLGSAALIVLLALLLAAAGSVFATTNRSSPASAGSTVVLAAPGVTAPTGQYFDYIVIILMENHNLCDIYTHCGGSGTYETSLSDNYSIPLDYRYCNVNPSLPNYLCLSGGSDFGCSGYDGGPNSNTCTGVAWNSQNVVDRLVTGGLSWKAYMEDMPSNCAGSDSGNYAVRHDPFVYYSDIASNSTRCSRVVPAGPTAGSDKTFLNDLNSTSTASNYMWLTPNTCNDMHDCSIATGDGYLGNLVPKILNSPVFTSQRAAVFIVFDEGYGQPTYATWAGPVVKHGYTSSAQYGHFSLLSTIEANWNLPYLNATNDGAAPAMGEFFASASPDFSISANPTHLALLPGQTGNSTISVQAIDGFTGSVSLSTSSSPAGVTASCNPSSITPGNTSTCSLSAANAGNYTVTVTGTSGSLSHSTSITLTVSLTPPPLSADFTFSPAAPVTGQSVTFTASVSGGTTPYSEAWSFGDGSSATGYVVNHAYASSGTYTVTLRVTDAASKTANASKAVTVASPPPPPALAANFTYSPSAPGEGQTVTFDATASGGTPPYSYAWDLGDGSTDSGASVSHSYGQLGNYTVVLTVTDAGSQTASATKVVAVGAAPPVTTLQAEGTAGAAGWYVSDVTLSLSATDPSNSPVTIHDRLDGGSWQVYSGPIVLGTGRHTLEYYATDGAGSQESTQTASFNVDMSPPTVTANLSGTPGRNGWYVSTVQVSLLATDDASGVASVSYLSDAGAWQLYSGPFSLADGMHTVEYAATDVAGLRSANQSTPVDIESITPVFTGLSPNGTVNASLITASWNATSVAGISEYQVSVDGAPYQDLGTSTSVLLQLPSGQHTIHIVAIDRAGQSSTATIHFQVQPTSTGTLPAPGANPPDPLLLMFAGFGALGLILVVGLGARAHGRRKRARRQRRQTSTRR